jgi:outer membrane receptor protein involved in Fe transport
VQYFGSRSVSENGPDGDFTNEFNAIIQGARRLPAQSYLDLYASWRLPLSQSSAVRELVLDFGVINALDTKPPRESSNFMDTDINGQGISPYGDPRLQRFELVLSVHF